MKFLSLDKVIVAFTASIFSVILFNPIIQLSITESILLVIVAFIPFYILMIIVDKIEDQED